MLGKLKMNSESYTSIHLFIQPKDQDAEIRRILNKKKGKDREALIDHLLKKDPMRFSWARKLKTKDK